MLNKTIIFAIVKLSITLTVSMFSSNLQISQVNTNPLTYFNGLWPCHCIFVRICDFALIRKGFMGFGLKGTKEKKPQEKCCSFLPVFFSFVDYLESCVRVFHFLQTLEHIDMRDLWGMYPSINKRTLSGHFPVKRLLN